MAAYFMYLVKNLPMPFAKCLLYVFNSIDIVDFLTYVLLIGGCFMVIHIIENPIRRLSGK